MYPTCTVAVDTLIVFNSRFDVPCIGASRSPGETIIGFFMDQNFSSWWWDGCFVEIECFMEYSVRRKLGVETTVVKKIHQTIPFFGREIWISNAQCGDRMIFEGLDCSLVLLHFEDEDEGG